MKVCSASQTLLEIWESHVNSHEFRITSLDSQSWNEWLGGPIMLSPLFCGLKRFQRFQKGKWAKALHDGFSCVFPLRDQTWAGIQG